ncbi:MAG: polysaccharide biosynthesis/export family protein, partial [Candidatus Schekmanbacteria bacterium]|nr:polysaccharide biosynthesis/export family protein [Candidatus Schekmanbacteria bacterium]
MKAFSKKIICSIAVSAFLATGWGCAPGISSTTAAQAGAAQALPPDADKYSLGPEDVIEISVWKEPELTKQIVVRPDGKITYPLIGEIQAAGLTVKDL